MASPKGWPSRSRRRRRRLAEREGFEPPCRLPGKTLSRRPRYDHFGTSPHLMLVVPSRRFPVCRQPSLSPLSEGCLAKAAKLRRRITVFLGKTPESYRGTRIRVLHQSPTSDGSTPGARGPAWPIRLHLPWAP